MDQGIWSVVGSSTALGIGASQPWSQLIETNYASHSVVLRNLAQNGSVTYSALPTDSPPFEGRPRPDTTANVDAALAGDPKPKLLLVSFPTNDTFYDYTVDETVRNLLTIRDAALAKGTAVIIFSTQPRALSDAQLAKLPQIDARVAEVAGPCFLPIREALAGPDGRLSPKYDAGDGVHPNDAGHAVIFDRLDKLIDTGSCVRVTGS